MNNSTRQEPASGGARVRKARRRTTPLKLPRFDGLPWKVHSGRSLDEPVPPVEWLAQGLWPVGSRGVLGGREKSLKSHMADGIALGVAAGLPVLGHWQVPRARPVVYLSGEGGVHLVQRRLQRLASDIYDGVQLGGLPLYIVDASGPVDGAEFMETAEALAEAMPDALFILDPLYAYHAHNIEVQNLYERGRMLNDLGGLFPKGVSLIVVDHFRKTGGQDLNLASLSQAGMGAWADSWILQDCSTADVPLGQFTIDVVCGSRQWSGAQYRLLWDTGPFDAEAGAHVGAISVAVEAASWAPGSSERKTASAVHVKRIVDLLAAHPYEYTKTEVRTKVGGDRSGFDKAWAELERGLHLPNKLEPRPNKTGRAVTQKRWAYSEKARLSATRADPPKATGSAVDPVATPPRRKATGSAKSSTGTDPVAGAKP